jgi:hypothetical protein
LYGYDPAGDLMLARNRYAAGVLRATCDPNPGITHDHWRPWAGENGLANAAQLGTAEIARLYGDYWYAGVDARRALRELGVECPTGQALDVFNKVVPPQLALENGDVARLKAGLTLTRAEFALVYSDLALRSRKTITTLAKGTKP